MNDIVYLEPDAEITGVIDKIRKSQNNAVVLVVPRGGTLGQSIINLKLLMRSAKEHDKAIALVSSDKITSNLANQLQIKIFSKVSDAEQAQIKPVTEIKKSEVEKEELNSLKVNTYQRYSLANLNAKAGLPEEDEIEPEVVEDSFDEEEPKFEKRPIPQTVDEYLDRADEEEKSEAKKVKVESDEEGEDDGDVEIERSAPKLQDVRLTKKHIKTEGSRKTLLAIAIAVLAILILTAGFFTIPKANALVVLKTHDLDENIDVVVSKDGKSASGALAVTGQILSVEKESTKTFNSTGTKNVGEKAKGTVTISNNGYSYQSPVKLAKGTKITSDSKIFITQTDVTVPVAKASAIIDANGNPALKTTPGTVDVEVVADQSGETYNLVANKTFSVAAYDKTKLFAQNSAALTGGTTKEIKVVTDKDLEDAVKALTAEILTAVKPELTDKATQASLRILESNISSDVVSQSPTKNINDEADTFDLKMKISFSAIGFKESDIKKSVLAGIEQKIKADEMIVNPVESEITYKIVESDLDSGQMKLQTVFKGKIGKELSPEKLKGEIKNKSVASAQSYLRSLEGVDTASIATWPSFWKRTPYSVKKIDVKFDYNK